MIKAIVVFGGDVEIPNDFGETPGLLAARNSKGEGASEQLYRMNPAFCLPFLAKTVSRRGENRPSVGNASPRSLPASSCWHSLS